MLSFLPPQSGYNESERRTKTAATTPQRRQHDRLGYHPSKAPPRMSCGPVRLPALLIRFSLRLLLQAAIHPGYLAVNGQAWLLSS